VRCTSSPNTRPSHAVPLLHRYPPRRPPRTARRGSALAAHTLVESGLTAALTSALCATTELPWPPLLQLPTAASMVACSRHIQPRAACHASLSRLLSLLSTDGRDGASPTATTRPRVAHRHPHLRLRRRSAGSSLASADRLPSGRILGELLRFRRSPPPSPSHPHRCRRRPRPPRRRRSCRRRLRPCRCRRLRRRSPGAKSSTEFPKAGFQD